MPAESILEILPRSIRHHLRIIYLVKEKFPPTQISGPGISKTISGLMRKNLLSKSCAQVKRSRDLALTVEAR